MVPDRREMDYPPGRKSEEAAAEGYSECAAEALQWLRNLGYEPGHPLIRSLLAHLTKKKAYLEKMDLERYLVGDPKILREDRQIQTALVEASFRGCDLKYF